MAGSGSGVWAPYKELFNVVHTAISLKQPQAYYPLENMLKKHKLDMLSLLKNPARNSAHRTQVQNATKNGLSISSLSQPLILPQDFIDEALILSDILDLNEIASVELLLVGEKHQPDFPSLSRGLVAVLLYYDGRRNLVSSLRSLIQGCEGISWTLGLEQNISSLVTNFIQELVLQNDLVGKIIRLLKDMNLETEMENLSRGKAIKDNQHRQQIVDLIKETHHGLMDCLLYLACQNPLPKDPLLKIILELKKVPGVDEGQSPLDPVSLSLLFTFLVSLRVSDTSSALDSSLVDEHYPFLADVSSLSLLHQEVTNKSPWLNSSLEAAVKFSWAVFLRECASLDTFNDCEELEDDERLIDEAIISQAFQFFRQSIIASPHFIQEEYYIRAVHHILTTYIHMMPVKITELRNHGDEVAREEMLRLLRGAPPSSSLDQNFGELMLLLGNLYSDDSHGLHLSLDYWPNSEQPSSQAQQHKTLSLYKFIHQCSDLLPSSLFHSFMVMLCGLSSSPMTAHYCFEFLKSNSPSQGGGGPSAVISFDHFFHSLRQYYIGLKQSLTHLSSGCGISPQELEGLVIVLKLITVIIEEDEIARGMIYDNSTWLPVATLFGLIGCPVSRTLKKQILLTLAGFAKSPEIAAVMWNTVEIAQILNTSMGTNFIGGTGGQLGLMTQAQQEGSLQIELEEMESAAEEYSLTRSFLVLLSRLIDIPIPVSLGADHRVPGFQPYLEFVRDSVFLKFDTRSYKDPQEKWMIASDALTVLLKLMDNHDLSPEDFTEQKYELTKGHFVTLPRQPGFVVLLHLMNDSALLRKLLYIICECYTLLVDVDSCTKEVEQVSLLSLKMLESALSKQERFLALLRSSSAHSVMATPLDSLLFGINPRSGQADHYLNITKYITLSKLGSELALVAVRIIGLASQSAVIGKNVLNSITADKESCTSVLHGFVEHLEWEDDPSSEDYQVQRQLKQDILKLLVSCVLRGTPNIAHLLLGFVHTKDSIGSRPKRISDTILQDPGVLGSPKTCLHSVLNFVKVTSHAHSSAGPPPQESCHVSHPKLAELSYHLLYCLSSSRELGQPILRYLRNNHDYFYAQLSQLPFPWFPGYHDDNDPDGEIHMSCYNQMSWILRCVAIELKMAVAANQRSHIQRLTSLLIKSPNSLSQEEIMASWSEEGFPTEQGVTRRKILLLLDLLELSSLATPTLELQYFDESRTEEVIRSCEVKESGGLVYVDVKLLHKLLMNELNSLQGTVAVSQKPYILKEIRGILDTVVKRNHTHEVLHTRKMYIESWQQVVEILMGVVSEEGKERIDVLFELIQDLLLKVEDCEANSLTAITYSVIFTLMSHLRHTLQSNNNSSLQQHDSITPAAGPLQSILRRLLDGLLQCPSGMQRLRSYLYATLLCYLHMTKERESDLENCRGGLWRLEYDSSLASGNLSILSGCGDNLMDTVCRDACSGHDIPKMLSLSILDSILYLDKHGIWLKFMITRGYLLTIVSSLQQDNQSLLRMLSPQPDALRPLYVYESKMAFLILVASTGLGARELISKNCIAMLSECTFIDQRPMHWEGSKTTEGFIPSVWTRYLQLYLPVLRFLLSLMSTSGPQQSQAISQVTDFIAAHIEVFMAVLKEGCPPVSMATLQELALVTAIISQCRAGQDWMLDMTHPHTIRLLQLQNLVLTLVPYYMLSSKWAEQPELEGGAYHQIGAKTVVDKELFEEKYNLSQKVCSNLVLYCRNTMSLGGKEFNSKNIRILFSCDLSKYATSLPSSSVKTSSLSLALLVSSLEELCDSHFSVLEKLQNMKNKLENLKNMTTDEMKHLHSDITSEETSQQILSPVQQYQQLKMALDRLIVNKQQQLEQFVYIIEHLLCILWCHLQFYLVHYQPSDQYTLSQVTNSSIKAMDGSTDLNGSKLDPMLQLSSDITMKDIEELKINAVKTLTDAFFKKLLDVSETQLSSTDMPSIGFIDGLVRRVRKLLKLRAAARPVLRLQ